MSVVDKASTAAPLELTDSNTEYFKLKDKEAPCIVTVPGSSSFDLSLFNVTAIGTVAAHVPGTLVLTLMGRAKEDGELLPLASSVAEPIGGEGELAETMWMIRGADLMIFLGSGKMQGVFLTNIADDPQAPLNLDQHPTDITDTDPLYIFGVGASFTPVITKGKRAAEPRADGSLCTVTMTSLTIDG